VQSHSGFCCFPYAVLPRLRRQPIQLRQFIDQQVGGVNKFKVPATDADIPLPRLPNGSVNPRYRTTEEKRYLGKLLFHDPVRTARIAQPASCGSCHLGEAAGKAGAQLNFAVGGEGRATRMKKGISSSAAGRDPISRSCGKSLSFPAMRLWTNFPPNGHLPHSSPISWAHRDHYSSSRPQAAPPRCAAAHGPARRTG
jgi:hypothetical protein